MIFRSTFGNEEADDWYCDQSGGANIQSCPSTDNTGFGGKKELRLPMGAALSLSAIDLKGYTSSQILFSYRAYNLKKGSKLTGDMYRSTGMVQNVIMESTADNTSNSYKEVRVNNAYKLDLFTNTLAANTGYYAVRYVLAQGHIPAYSLFSGNGFWSDSLCWSHLPAMRNDRKSVV